MTDEKIDEERASTAPQDKVNTSANVAPETEVKTESEPKAEVKTEAPAETEATETPKPVATPRNENVAPSEEKKLTTTDIPESDAKAEVIELPYQEIKPGMLVRVHEKIKEANSKGEVKERVQVFEGMVLGMKSAGVARTITVRKNSKGWMVEKIFPLSSPNIEKIEVVKEFQVRRAKITFLRGKHKRKMKEVKK